MELEGEPKQLNDYQIDLQLAKLEGLEPQWISDCRIDLLNADVSGADLLNADLLELEWLSAETNLNSPE